MDFRFLRWFIPTRQVRGDTAEHSVNRTVASVNGGPLSPCDRRVDAAHLPHVDKALGRDVIDPHGDLVRVSRQHDPWTSTPIEECHTVAIGVVARLLSPTRNAIQPHALSPDFMPRRAGGVHQGFKEFKRVSVHRTRKYRLPEFDPMKITAYDFAPPDGLAMLPGVRSELLRQVTRIVVKLGTGILTDEAKRPDWGQLTQLVAQVAGLRSLGHEVVLVTSGAVGAGMGVLGFGRRPSALAELQACAAVGQSRLMSTYERLFEVHRLTVAQVLLTHDDLEHHERHLNARNTLVALLQRGVIPIINENDAVSFTELRFGDNDKLSALVACLLPADLLVILTTSDGLMEHFGTPKCRLLTQVDSIDDRIIAMAGGTTSATAVGGMATKIQAARMAVRSGIPLIIAPGRKSTVLARIVAGEVEGTLFVPRPARLRGRKRWIAFFHHPKGTLVVDDGARKALRDRGTSLLAPGIVRQEGSFAPGDVVRICDAEGTEFARGLSRVSATDLSVQSRPREVIVHRDDLVLL